jgi:hypothetical protein
MSEKFRRSEVNSETEELRCIKTGVKELREGSFSRLED